MADFSFELIIQPVISAEDSYLTAGSNFATTMDELDNPSYNTYAIEAMQLSYSIINSSTPGEIILSTPLSIYSGINKINVGQIVIVNKYTKANGSIIFFVGYITSINYLNSGSVGNYITLQVDSLLSQLKLLTFINNLAQGEAYGITTLGLFNNQITQQNLWSNATQGSLIQLASTQFIDYSNLPYPPFNIIDGEVGVLPDKLWAICQLNENRDNVIREILTPYNRIMWQDQDGTINIQPLFYNDKNSNWSVINGDNDAYPAKYMNFRFIDNSALMINQITQVYAIPFTGVLLNLNQDLQATVSPNATYFARVNQLKNSNYFNNGILQYKSLSQKIVQDPTLMTWQSLYSNGGYIANGSGQVYNIPELYAQQTLANELMSAYNLVIDYLFESVKDFDLPLGQVVDIYSLDDILPDDTNWFLCYQAIFKFGLGSGTTISLSYAPINSITGVWDNLAT